MSDAKLFMHANAVALSGFRWDYWCVGAISNIVLHWESLLLVIRKPRLTNDIALHKNVCCVCARSLALSHTYSTQCEIYGLCIPTEYLSLNLETVQFAREMLKSLIDMRWIPFKSCNQTGNRIIKYIFICIWLDSVEIRGLKWPLHGLKRTDNWKTCFNFEQQSCQNWALRQNHRERYSKLEDIGSRL